MLPPPGLLPLGESKNASAGAPQDYRTPAPTQAPPQPAVSYSSGDVGDFAEMPADSDQYLSAKLVADIGQQTKMTGALNRNGKLTLMARTGAGYNGSDQLNVAMLVLSIALLLVSRLLRIRIFYWLSFILLVLCYLFLEIRQGVFW